MYGMFYVNDEPEGKFLYTETIKLFVDSAYCYYFNVSSEAVGHVCETFQSSFCVCLLLYH